MIGDERAIQETEPSGRPKYQKGSMKRNIVRIRLVTVVIALLAAITSLCQACVNSSELKVQKAEIGNLQTVTTAVAVDLTIDVPEEGEIITSGTYDDMEGSYVGKLPSGYRLWVLARDQYNYFLMYPPTQVTPTMGRWSQTNVRLATPGPWELHVCVGNEVASRWLEARAKKRNWSGFPSPPEGMETVRYVTVKRQ